MYNLKKSGNEMSEISVVSLNFNNVPKRLSVRRSANADNASSDQKQKQKQKREQKKTRASESSSVKWSSTDQSDQSEPQSHDQSGGYRGDTEALHSILGGGMSSVTDSESIYGGGNTKRKFRSLYNANKYSGNKKKHSDEKKSSSTEYGDTSELTDTEATTTEAIISKATISETTTSEATESELSESTSGQNGGAKRGYFRSMRGGSRSSDMSSSTTNRSSEYGDDYSMTSDYSETDTEYSTSQEGGGNSSDHAKALHRTYMAAMKHQSRMTNPQSGGAKKTDEKKKLPAKIVFMNEIKAKIHVKDSDPKPKDAKLKALVDKTKNIPYPYKSFIAKLAAVDVAKKLGYIGKKDDDLKNLKDEHITSEFKKETMDMLHKNIDSYVARAIKQKEEKDKKRKDKK